MQDPQRLSDPASLRRRLEKLEKRQRWMIILPCGMAAVILIAAASPSPSRSEVIEARSFRLVDRQGAVRAELTIASDGAAGLLIHDEEQRVRVSLTHDDNQSALFFTDDAGQVRVGVAQFAHGGGGVALHGPHGKGSTALYHKGKGSLTFYGDDGDVMRRVASGAD